MARRKSKNNKIKTKKKKGGTRRRVKSASLKRSKKNKSKRNKSEGSKPKYRLGPYAPLPRRGETRAQFNRRRRRRRTARNVGRMLEVTRARAVSPPSSPPPRGN